MARGYRADIDGLRAIAVLSVVVFHLNPAWLPGGYVGVDIFFVISGFLITGILWRSLESGDFSFADFYLRRVRRILPAFLAMTAITLAAGAFLLLPADLETLSRSARYAVFSAANIYYWRHLDTGYFAASSEEQPLLHTWSLGVEEQFYLLWPALLAAAFLLARRKRAPAVILAFALSAASILLSEAMLVSHPKFAYFMLPTRAGELMLGSILALALHGRDAAPALERTQWGFEASLLVGLALIVYSLVSFDAATPFPGLHAALPCVGAALTILGGARARLAQALLTSRPIVFIGLVSYSLYLWHWPILAFLRYFYTELTLLQLALAAAAMWCMAVLSYRYIEQPARHVTGPKWRQLATFALVPMFLLSIGTRILIRTDGLESIRDDRFARVLEETAPAFQYPENCQQQAFDPTILNQERCVNALGAAGQAKVMLWGDSHAAHYLGAALTIADSERVPLRNATLSACPPVFGGHYGSDIYGKGCDAFRSHMEQHLKSGAFSGVILGANWSAYDSPTFRLDLERTLAALSEHGVRVSLLEEVPSFAGYRRSCEARWALLPANHPCSISVQDTASPINDYLRQVAARRSMPYLSLRTALCEAGSCRTSLEGRSVYYDPGHLSMSGSRAIGAYLLRTGQAGDWRRVLAEGLTAHAGADGESNTSVQPL